MHSLFEIQHLSYAYHTMQGETAALSDITFTVNTGDFVAIVGPSGCGKSTLLNLLAGMLTPESGTLLLNGIPLTADSRCHIGYMLQQDYLLEWRSIWKNVLLGLEIRHEVTEESCSYAKQLLKQYGLEKFSHSKPSQLSGGMRQRVMIAMAMSSDPKILIADEPTTALDVTIQAQILHLLLELQKKNNMSIILITHDLGVVAQTCKRVAVMCGGYVVEEGTVEEIFLHPGHPYTQALIASMPRVGGTFEQFLERDLSDGNGDLCPFLNRCKYADKTCEACLPKYYEASEGHRIFCHRREEKR